MRPRIIASFSLPLLLFFPLVARLWAESGDAAPLNQLVDRHVAANLQKPQITPAERCSDAEFLRRVYLDFSGTIPDEKTARDFIANNDTGKRTQLIERLLASDEFAQHMARVFDVMLMERRPDKYVTTNEWRGYLADSFAKNKPLDVLTREILGADGVDPVLRPAAKFYLDRTVDKDTLVRDIGRLFLGVNLQCVQCHNHPNIDDYLHEHYYGLSVFIDGSKTFRQPDGKSVLQEMVSREVEFASVFEPDKNRKTGPRLLDGPVLEVPEFKEGEEYVEKPSRTVRAVPKFSLRGLLAEKLPSDETPAFARNMVNRLWAMMMGRGLVHPLDMHHADNPPSHPELLELLATRFRETKFDTKSLLRELALSGTYQRSSMIPEGIDPQSVPPESFAVGIMKGLSPEQLFHSLVQATGSRSILDAQIDESLKEDAEKYKEPASDEKKLAEARAGKMAERVKEFIGLFGSPVGQAQGEFQASLPQSLFLANSETIVSWIEPKSGNLSEQLLKLDDSTKIAEQVYLNVLSRMPLDEETKQVQLHLESRGDDRRAAVVELVWSLIASAEFRLNH